MIFNWQVHCSTRCGRAARRRHVQGAGHVSRDQLACVAITSGAVRPSSSCSSSRQGGRTHAACPAHPHTMSAAVHRVQRPRLQEPRRPRPPLHNCDQRDRQHLQPWCRLAPLRENTRRASRVQDLPLGNLRARFRRRQRTLHCARSESTFIVHTRCALQLIKKNCCNQCVKGTKRQVEEDSRDKETNMEVRRPLHATKRLLLLFSCFPSPQSKPIPHTTVFAAGAPPPACN